jgi:hypothetical protein
MMLFTVPKPSRTNVINLSSVISPGLKPTAVTTRIMTSLVVLFSGSAAVFVDDHIHAWSGPKDHPM